MDEVITKLSNMVKEYEIILSDIKKNLKFQNIRKVYRMLHLGMPEEL